MSARFKHIAIVSEQARQACDFYEELFGVNREEGRATFDDGVVGFNILTRRNGNNAGANHYGFSIESIEDFEARLHDLYPKIGLVKRPEARGYADWGTHDPEGNAFDLAPLTKTRRGTHTNTLVDRPNTRHISHFAINAMDPPVVAKFYKDMLDLDELTKLDGDERFYLSDGMITLVIQQWDITNFKGGIDYKPTIDHLGWHVESLSTFLADVERIGRERPEIMPKPFQGEGELRRELLAQCSLGRYQMADSEGVLMDLSEL